MSWHSCSLNCGECRRKGPLDGDLLLVKAQPAYQFVIPLLSSSGGHSSAGSVLGDRQQKLVTPENIDRLTVNVYYIQYSVINIQITVLPVQKALIQIQLRLQVALGRRLTYRELAELAGTSERTMAEWMRGATAPMAMNGLLNLMSQLSEDDAKDVLMQWRQESPLKPSDAIKAVEHHQ